MNTKITETITAISTENISKERKETLKSLIEYIKPKLFENKGVRINFICTHNSRRSHLSQVWAQTMAHHFGLSNVTCFSGGTESTAMFPMVAETLKKDGFTIETISDSNNPIYAIKFDANEHPIIGFSKRFDDAFNPESSFAAIMTCSQADAGCPFIPGAEKRIPITYEDPKLFDGTPEQEEKYLERSRQIASEMLYVFSEVTKN
ncbi:arsenate-mycothiol transferase ArsC [Galbibacter mesophilus]|uniref:arsenate-mycothiol transferase ArsC n=1 Tax=Galbibacter mesophilus TaxID=379069 RepID=UPI00191E3EA0|nr:protein-tyrosine-phosphatase [Galbibacter mesophilus]MCM5663327.1 protein-tyrosine-phosphatase [Galbibacter mesophilus]